jgi:hypothetical protein
MRIGETTCLLIRNPLIRNPHSGESATRIPPSPLTSPPAACCNPP